MKPFIDSFRPGGILCVVLLAACGAADPSDRGYAVRDSAGVRIVEVAGAAWSAGDGWEVSARPALEIGVVSGDSAYQLFRVRMALRLSDGGIVIANAGTHELRFYSAAGEHLRSAGGEGGGPGEFQSLTALYRFGGDSLLVYDAASDRVSVFDADGDFVRDVYLPAMVDGEPPRIVGVLEDGTLVGQRSLEDTREPDGYTRERFEVIVVRPGAEEPIRLGAFPGTESIVHQSRSGNIFRISERSVPFSRATFLAAAADRVYAGTNDTYRIEAYGPDGALARVIRRADPRTEPVTDDHIDRMADFWIDYTDARSIRGDRPTPDEIRDNYRELWRAPSLPAYARLLVDEADHLWVEDYWMPWESEGSRNWTVYAPDGRMLGDVRTPAGLRVTQIGEDFVVGIAHDELNVEHARVYELDRGA